ncbi:MAG: LytTR family transcriptional regulator [Lachnospiraceae bacterium]|jgi:DNA-binding LytR/AlgR family response regulator|nr:LytTR family transcriptional regulator [Lachnospiraceae bacterium]
MHFMKIAVCHNNRHRNNEICRGIESALESFKTNGEIQSFVSPSMLLNTLDKVKFDIIVIFLEDALLNEKIKQMRMVNPFFSLIFIADESLANAKKLMRLDIVGLITDTSSFSDVQIAIGAAIEAQSRFGMITKGDRFSLRTRVQIISFYYSEIDYFSNDQRKVTLHSSVRCEKVEWYAKFSALYESLPKRRFVRCHQSFIVNMEKIHILNRAEGKITMQNGEVIYISKLNHADTLLAYQNFLGLTIDQNTDKILI